MAQTREEAVRSGMWFSGQMLIDQADVSLALAVEDMAELKKYGWSEAKQKNLGELRQNMKQSIAKWGGAKEAIPVATAKQTDAVVAAKLWLRRAVPVAKNALEGLADLDSFLKLGDISTMPKLMRAMTDKVGIFERHSKELAADGIGVEFVKQGKTISENLSGAEGAQENERKSLPKEAEEYAYQKGLLRLALKSLNRVGQAAFADDRQRKMRYSFEVLYRTKTAKSRPKANA